MEYESKWIVIILMEYKWSIGLYPSVSSINSQTKSSFSWQKPSNSMGVFPSAMITDCRRVSTVTTIALFTFFIVNTAIVIGWQTYSSPSIAMITGMQCEFCGRGVDRSSDCWSSMASSTTSYLSRSVCGHSTSFFFRFAKSIHPMDRQWMKHLFL